MYKVLIMSCIAASFLTAQEKATRGGSRDFTHHLLATTAVTQSAYPFTYAARDVRILGDLDFGKNSGFVPYSMRPPYSAFVFSAFGGETVEITVKGATRKAMVALADASLNRLVMGDSSLRVTLPYRGPYIECWYIIFRDFDGKPARFSVQVNKIGGGDLRDAGNVVALQ